VTPRRLLRILGVYVGVLAACSVILFCVIRLDRSGVVRGPTLVTVWKGGVRRARDEEAAPGATRIVEQIVDSAPILPFGRLVFAASVAPVRDGVSATYHGQTAYLTPDDLLKLEAYEGNVSLGPLVLVLGIDPDKVLGALASELHATPDELFRQGSFRRFSVARDERYPKRNAGEPLSTDALKSAVRGAARYLVQNQHPDGSFRYEVNAVTGGDESGYNYPRHAGATYFLARTANQFHDSRLFHAAELAGMFMKEHATLSCGAHSCVGEGDTVDVGASALATLAYVELQNGGADAFREPALELAGFLRAQQRSDGDFQHIYSVAEQHPVDIQLEYYTGEAAFALSRVARVSGDARDLDAARRALSFLVHRPALFLGAHYFWDAEHWTCQVLEDLWQRAPDRAALKFCLDWQAANRVLMYSSPPMRAEYDGGISRGPFLSPRLTPLGSRMEAAVATLSVARQAGVAASEIEALETEIQHGFGFLLRYQYTPGPAYLMPDPRALAGGFPGSPVDLHVRIDYPQHAGGALLRYWELKQQLR
jgi:hypothetical protein